MKIRKTFIRLTFNLSLEISVGVWQTDWRWPALVKRRDRLVGARSTQTDNVLGLSWGSGFGEGRSRHEWWANGSFSVHYDLLNRGHEIDGVKKQKWLWNQEDGGGNPRENKAERRGIVAFKHEELELYEKHLSDNSQWKESWT